MGRLQTNAMFARGGLGKAHNGRSLNAVVVTVATGANSTNDQSLASLS